MTEPRGRAAHAAPPVALPYRSAPPLLDHVDRGRHRAAASPATCVRSSTIGRLLLSIHDVGPRFEGEVDRLRDLLARQVTPDGAALFVVPDHWGAAPIRPGSAFARRLRGWAEQGAEVFLHGWYHQDLASHRSWRRRLAARHLTAGEGEFLGLSRAEAARRMRDGRRLLEDVTGRAVAGFVAPAWLYGPGARQALADEGFELAEDHWRVWNPRQGRSLCVNPVLTWASRSRMRIASSLTAAALLPTILRTLPVARIGVHPGDVQQPKLVVSIERTIGRFLLSHRLARYAELQAEDASPCAS